MSEQKAISRCLRSRIHGQPETDPHPPNPRSLRRVITGHQRDHTTPSPYGVGRARGTFRESLPKNPSGAFSQLLGEEGGDDESNKNGLPVPVPLWRSQLHVHFQPSVPISDENAQRFPLIPGQSAPASRSTRALKSSGPQPFWLPGTGFIEDNFSTDRGGMVLG